MQKLRRGFSIFSSLTLLSRCLGLIRDFGFAFVLGAGGNLDIFLLAFRLPNTLRRFVGDGALNQALVPELAHAQAEDKAHGPNQLLAYLHGRYFIFLIGVAIGLWVCAPVIINGFAPGFTEIATVRAIYLFRIMVPYVVLVGYSAIWLAAFNFEHKFHYGAIFPIFLNMAFLVALFGAWKDGLVDATIVLAYAVVVAAFLQLIWVVHAWVRAFGWPGTMWPKPIWSGLGKKGGNKSHIYKLDSDRIMGKISRRMVAGWFGGSVVQLSILIDTLVASLLGVGSISWLYFADRINNLPLGVLGVGLATVILPVFSKHVAHQEQDELKKSLLWAIESWAWWILPATVGLVMLAPMIISSLFAHGQFGATDVMMTSKALGAFAIGLPAAVMIKILVAWYNAHGQMQYPVRSAWCALLVSIPLTVYLGFRLGHVGLAYASSCAAYLNCCILIYYWRVFAIRVTIKEMLSRVLPQLVSSLLMGLVLGFMRGRFSFTQMSPGHFAYQHSLFVLGGEVAVAMIVYWTLSYCMGASIIQWWQQRG